MMCRIVARIVLIMWVGMVAGCAAEDRDVEEKPLSTDRQKFSYAMGMDVARALKKLETEIDLAAFLKGAEDSFTGSEPLMSPDEVLAVKKEVAVKEKEKQRLKREALAKRNLEQGSAFLEKNKKDKGVTVTASGLQYKLLRPGRGQMPAQDDVVKIHYRMTGIDGTEFDSSYKRGKPETIPVKGVIPGLREALQLIAEGAKARVYIPPELAYGDKSAGPRGRIAPNSTLICEVELLGIEKKPKES